MPILFHIKMEIRIAMTVLDGFPHDAPKASEIPWCCRVKALPPGRPHIQRTKKSVMYWQKTANLKTLYSLNILYLRKRENNFPYLSQFHVYSLH